MARLQVTERGLDTIRPYASNPRNNAPAVSAVAESIREFGWRVPIVIDRDGVIIAGHTRYLAAKKLKLSAVPCVLADDLTPEQVQAYRLADNKTSELSEWNFEALEVELSKIAELDMTRFGFAPKPPQVRDDRFKPEIPENSSTQPGDLYRLGRHFLLCGDCTDYDAVETLWDIGGDVDMLLTDPPYGVNVRGTAGSILNDTLSGPAFRRFLATAFHNVVPMLKRGGAFHIWHSEAAGYEFRGACMDAGLQVRQCLIWVKDRATLCRQDFQWQHEPVLSGEKPEAWTHPDPWTQDEYAPCLYGWRSGAAHRWYKRRKEKTVLYFDRPAASREHPTMKPVLLFDYEMQCSTVPGDVVLDPFAGSGTTLIAAEQNGRTALLMELDPRYADVIVNRWEALTGQRAVLEGNIGGKEAAG